MSYKYVRWFEEINIKDVPIVGGKNASLGEMIQKLKAEGVPVPEGFATTAEAFWKFIEANRIKENIRSYIENFQIAKTGLEETGKAIRRLFMDGEFPREIARELGDAYRELSRRYNLREADVAVRSSATAEDLPSASFAGQQETFLNITGEKQLLDACRKCYASLFTNRAIIYRQNQGFDQLKIALSIGIQKMVRSDKAGAGVTFTLDTETGFRNVIEINASWGLGENVVQGAVTPDEYMAFKPLLDKPGFKPVIEKKLGTKEQKMIYVHEGTKTTKNVPTTEKERESFVLEDDEILELSRWAVLIENHYGQPMDIEWAKDGELGKLFIVQARPETVQSRKIPDVFMDYTLLERGEVLLRGLAIGDAIASGKAQIIKSADEIDRFEDGSILVTGMTDPDWVPIMKKASGIVTDYGGRTSHAAIVSRELGVPAVVGTEVATRTLKDGEEITLSCAEGDEGFIYKGKLKFDKKEINVEEYPHTETKIMMNISGPAASFRWWRLPVEGIGLARMEFIIGNIIKIHPMALVHFDKLKDEKAKAEIEKLTRGHADKTEYFIDHLSRGAAKIAASQYPKQVIVRTSDFKTNEYANLVGGKEFETHESNPMLGFRGASRYYSPRYREGFALECKALKRAREEIGMENITIMIPFCRTLEEADKVLEELAKNGLKRGEKGLLVYVMAEIPSNIILADEFSKRFDGFSIGSNDLTQLVLGIDRDSAELAPLFDEKNEAVLRMIKELINVAHRSERKVGICGQGPSDKPDFAEFLVQAGIDSISLNPDSVLKTIKYIARIEEAVHA